MKYTLALCSPDTTPNRKFLVYSLSLIVFLSDFWDHFPQSKTFCRLFVISSRSLIPWFNLCLSGQSRETYALYIFDRRLIFKGQLDWCLNYWWKYLRRIDGAHDLMDVRNLKRTKYLYIYKCFQSKDVCVSHSVILTLCHPDCSPPVSAHGIPQVSILEWFAIPTSQIRDLPKPGIKPSSPALQEILYHYCHREALSKDEENKIKWIIIKNFQNFTL